MKRIFAALLALALAAPLAISGNSQRGANFAFRYDVDGVANTFTYTRLLGQGGDPYSGSAQGPGTLDTVGASTTVTENVASTNPFRDIAVGDVIVVQRSTNARDIVVVTAKASDASITVDTSVDWSVGVSWRYIKLQTGTTANDGWISVTGAQAAALTVQYDQGDLDALRVRFECLPLGLGGAPVIVYPGEASDCGLGGTLVTDRCAFATAGVTARLTVVVQPLVFSACRIGLAFATTDTSDAGANVEQVTASVALDVVN